MKRIVFILLTALALVGCEQNTPVHLTGDLLITVEYDGFSEENVDIWLYDSKYGFENFEFYDVQLTDENGEVFWAELSPGRYYIEAEITKPGDFFLFAIDSTEIVGDVQRNKRLILTHPD